MHKNSTWDVISENISEGSRREKAGRKIKSMGLYMSHCCGSWCSIPPRTLAHRMPLRIAQTPTTARIKRESTYLSAPPATLGAPRDMTTPTLLGCSYMCAIWGPATSTALQELQGREWSMWAHAWSQRCLQNMSGSPRRASHHSHSWNLGEAKKVWEEPTRCLLHKSLALLKYPLLPFKSNPIKLESSRLNIHS